jgi:hypothetical protein
MGMYHYTECGLLNVYLVNSYRRLETEYGEAVSIDGVGELHEGTNWTGRT